MITRIRTLLRTRAEAIADRIHSPGDARARAAGLTVERLPGGGRRMADPRVPVWLERRRQRLARTGGDAIDRALMDPATRRAFEARRRLARAGRAAGQRVA